MKNIKYSEPKSYMPKEIMEKYFGKGKGKAKSGTAKKTGATKKKTK